MDNPRSAAPTGAFARGSEPGSQAYWSEVCARIAGGEQRAFETLYAEVSPVIYGICLRLIRNAAQAAEVTQEAMLELWNTAERYNAREGTVYAWAGTVGRRRAIDRIRSEESRSQRETRSLTLERDVDSVGERLLDAVDSARVRDCLGTLTVKEKQTVVDTYYGGCTYSEVAERRGLPLPTVKSRIRSALKRLKTCLEVT